MTNFAPIPFEPNCGEDAVALYPEAPTNVHELIRGVAGCSSYLRGLLRTECTWLSGVLNTDPMDIWPSLRSEAVEEGYETAGHSLRKAKRRLALYAALADVGGMWPLEQVTRTLTDLADFSVDYALKSLISNELERNRLPGFSEEDVLNACGVSVLAMGKMGAHELNYSSDIDLIVLFDETKVKEDNFDTIRERFIRITRRMAKILSDVTVDGYVFRTDLRLRPDPSVTPVCLSMGAAERYYESLGRTWERAAFIKARPCAGDIAAGHSFLETLRPFVWRKHLDYVAIQDAHDMRLRIREHKGLGGPITLPAHNIKLGRGGIREIEFFTQIRQIIAGGRDPDLRLRETCESLAVLAEKRWISDDVSKALAEAYREHRKIEHRIQMLADAQTHNLPSSDDNMVRLANFCGEADTSQFTADIWHRLELVHSLTESFFAPDTLDSQAETALSNSSREMVEKWRNYPALRTTRANEIFNRLQPVILHCVGETAHPNETLRQFDGFLADLPAGVQLFALFEANPQLVDLLISICGSAPSLARYLSRNAQVFDGVIAGTFFEALPGVTELVVSLEYSLAGIEDYEDQLNAARRWMKEQHFRIGVQHLKGMIDGRQAAVNYSDLAESCLRVVFPVVAAHFSKRHGPLPGRGAAVLGMGSLGTRSLTATSDLDVIVIYDAQGEEASEGLRPLAVSTYFARLTQALVTALASPMPEGRLYEVDMRLRPSGRKGPVATPLNGFLNYQRNEAWTWEHLALTRARIVAGHETLGREIESFRCEIITLPRNPDDILSDVAEMRARLAAGADKLRIENAWETKLGPGRMLDIELLAQTAALLTGHMERNVVAQLSGGVSLGWYTDRDLGELQESYQRLADIQQIGRLLVEGKLTLDELGQGGCALLLAEVDMRTIEDLEAKLHAMQIMANEMVDGVLGRAKN